MPSILIKLTLSILLLLCLLDMPYGYYQFVRLAATVAFAFLAYNSYKEGIEIIAFLYGGLALLFQPFFKIALGRDIWNVVDIIVSIWLVYSIIIDFKQENK